MNNQLNESLVPHDRSGRATLAAAQARVQEAVSAGHQPVAIDAALAHEVDDALCRAGLQAYRASTALHRAGLAESEVVQRICALARELEGLRKSLAVQMFVR